MSNRELGTVRTKVLTPYTANGDAVRLSSDLALTAPSKETTASTGFDSRNCSSEQWLDGELALVDAGSGASGFGDVGLFRGHSTLPAHPILGPGRMRLEYYWGGESYAGNTAFSKSGYPSLVRSTSKSGVRWYWITTNGDGPSASRAPTTATTDPATPLALDYNGAAAIKSSNCFNVSFDADNDEIVLGVDGVWLVSLVIDANDVGGTFTGSVLARLTDVATSELVAQADCISPADVISEVTTVLWSATKGTRLAVTTHVPTPPAATSYMRVSVVLTRVAPYAT